MDRRQKQYMRPLPRTGTMAFQQPCAISIYFDQDRNLFEWQAVALKPKRRGKKTQQFEICSPGEHGTIVVMAAPINGKRGETHHVSVHVAGLVCAPYDPKNISRKRVHEDATIGEEGGPSYGTYISSTHIIMKRSKKTSERTSSEGDKISVKGYYNTNPDLFNTIAKLVFEMTVDTNDSREYTLKYNNPSSNAEKLRFNSAVGILGLQLNLQDIPTVTNTDIVTASSDVMSKMMGVINKYRSEAVNRKKIMETQRGDINGHKKTIIEANRLVKAHKEANNALTIANQQLTKHASEFDERVRREILERNVEVRTELTTAIKRHAAEIADFTALVAVLEEELTNTHEQNNKRTLQLGQATTRIDLLQTENKILTSDHGRLQAKITQQTIDHDTLDREVVFLQKENEVLESTLNEQPRNGESIRSVRKLDANGLGESMPNPPKRAPSKNKPASSSKKGDASPTTNEEDAKSEFMENFRLKGISFPNKPPKVAYTEFNNGLLYDIIEHVQGLEASSVPGDKVNVGKLNTAIIKQCIKLGLNSDFYNDMAASRVPKVLVAITVSNVKAKYWLSESGDDKNNEKPNLYLYVQE